MDEILDAFGLKFNELTLDEQNDLFNMVNIIEQQKSLSVDDIKSFMQDCLNEVMLALAKEPEGTTNNIHLKARMMNYVGLLGILKGPESARAELDTYLENVKKMQNTKR